MANNENLKPIRTKNEAREKGRNGGIKSGIKRRERKTMKEILDYLLTENAVDVFGEDRGMTNVEAIMLETIASAIKGNLKAVEFIRDTIGEKPTVRQETNINNFSLFEEEIERKVKELVTKHEET